jgi:hypothetical protein
MDLCSSSHWRYYFDHYYSWPTLQTESDEEVGLKSEAYYLEVLYVIFCNKFK